jgi:hypothetical protein
MVPVWLGLVLFGALFVDGLVRHGETSVTMPSWISFPFLISAYAVIAFHCAIASGGQR